MMKNPLSLLPVGLLAMFQPLFAQWAPERHPMYDSAAPHEAKEEAAARQLQMAALGDAHADDVREARQIVEETAASIRL